MSPHDSKRLFTSVPLALAPSSSNSDSLDCSPLHRLVWQLTFGGLEVVFAQTMFASSALVVSEGHSALYAWSDISIVILGSAGVVVSLSVALSDWFMGPVAAQTCIQRT